MASVLAVDDNEKTLQLLDIALSEKGYRVVIAINGKLALEYLDQDPSVEIMLLDLVMPFYDGRTVIERIRANPKTQHLPIILLTGSEYDQDLFPPENSYQALVKKPFDLPELLSLIERLLGNGKNRMTVAV